MRVHSADPHMHHLVVYFTSHQARGSRQLGRSGCTRLLFSLQFQICALNLSRSRPLSVITHDASRTALPYRDRPPYADPCGLHLQLQPMY